MDRKGWCLIPPSAFHDDRLTNTDKLLIGIIIPLVGQTGYCWAGNDYLGNQLSKSERSIQRAINSLKDAGYLNVYHDDGYRRMTVDLTGGDRFVVDGVTKMSPDMFTPVTDVTQETQEETEEQRSKKLEKKKQIREVFDYWTAKRETYLKSRGRTFYHARLTDTRREHVSGRLSDGHTVALIKKAIDGCFASPWHIENGVIELANITKNNEKLEFFIGKYDSAFSVAPSNDMDEWEESE